MPGHIPWYGVGSCTVAAGRTICLDRGEIDRQLPKPSLIRGLWPACGILARVHLSRAPLRRIAGRRAQLSLAKLSKGRQLVTMQAHVSRLTDSTVGSLLVTALLSIGVVVVLKGVVRAFWGLYVYLLRPGRNLKKLGGWAVVTGATDGIGRAYANALAKEGTAIDSAGSSRSRAVCDWVVIFPSMLGRRTSLYASTGTDSFLLP